MIRYLFLAMALLSTTPERAASFELIRKMNLPATRFSVDIMGQLYWSEDASLYRVNPITGEKTEYTNTFLGEIHSWDASNPLKILVFHKDFNTLAFLDKNLSPIQSPVNLDQVLSAQATASCISNEGGFWLINPATGQIQQYNSGLNRTQQSSVIPELSGSDQPNPVIREHHRNLYCLIPHCCGLIFDRFGNLQQRRPLKNVDNIQILNQNIYYFYQGDLYKLDKNLENTEKINLPETKGQWDYARMGPKNRLYLLRDHQLYIYKI